MSDSGVRPRSEGKFRTNSGRQNYSMPQSSIVKWMPPRPSRVPVRDEVESLPRERLDLHSELFEAAQIQRKLSGPREFRHGSLRRLTQGLVQENYALQNVRQGHLP
jgi:hypothetical protein